MGKRSHHAKWQGICHIGGQGGYTLLSFMPIPIIPFTGEEGTDRLVTFGISLVVGIIIGVIRYEEDK